MDRSRTPYAWIIVALVLLCGTWGTLAVPDCNGDEGGIAVISPCGICCRGNTSVSCFDTMDCSGVCNGNGTIDNCSNCIHPEGETLNSTECTASCTALANACLLDCGGAGICILICSSANLNCLFTCDTNRTEDCNGDCPPITSDPNATGDAIIGPDGECCAGLTGVNCSESLDCNGIPNGNGTLDECGNCVQPAGQELNISECESGCGNVFDACIADCGVSTICFTVCTAQRVVCKLLCNVTITKDCNGDCGGTAIVNACDICVLGNTSLPLDEGLDCNDDCNGTAVIDDCRVCAGGNTRNVPNEDKDCAGVCFGNATRDQCGICNGDGTSCCNCPRSAGYWKTHNCFSRSKNFRRNGGSKRLRRDWPGQYSDCDEETCSMQWLDILWAPSKGNAWNILARQFIAAQLNLENLACFADDDARDQVIEWIAAAQQLLEDNCATIGAGHPDRAEALELKDFLEGFNTKENETLLSSNCTDADETNDGPDDDEDDDGKRKKSLFESFLFGDNVRKRKANRGRLRKAVLKKIEQTTRILPACFEASVIQQGIKTDGQVSLELEAVGILPGDPVLQCIDGCTLPPDYWVQHNNEQDHPKLFAEWQASSSLEACTICGETMLSLISSDPLLTNDSYVFVAKQWVAAVTNVKNGACLTQVVADSLFDSLLLMEQNCVVQGRKRNEHDGHDYIPIPSELGQLLMELYEQLEAYNSGEWGPYEYLLEVLYENYECEECDDDDENCSEDTQRGYLIWAIIVTVVIVVCGLLGLIGVCIYYAMTNNGSGGGGTNPPRDANQRISARRYEPRVQTRQRFSSPDLWKGE